MMLKFKSFESEFYMQHGIERRFDELHSKYKLKTNDIKLKLVTDDGYKCVLLFSNKEVIGYCDFMLRKEEKEIYIESIYISKGSRNKGYATMVLDGIKRLYPNYNLSKDLDYTKSGKKFFKKYNSN